MSVSIELCIDTDIAFPLAIESPAKPNDTMEGESWIAGQANLGFFAHRPKENIEGRDGSIDEECQQKRQAKIEKTSTSYLNGNVVLLKFRSRSLHSENHMFLPNKGKENLFVKFFLILPVFLGRK